MIELEQRLKDLNPDIYNIYLKNSNWHCAKDILLALIEVTTFLTKDIEEIDQEAYDEGYRNGYEVGLSDGLEQGEENT